MFFLNPAVLIVLVASITPIIIHFIYRQRKEYINFSSIYFIKEIEKKKPIKTSWLEYLLLLLRVLTIMCIVFAFSKPLSNIKIPFSIKEKQHYVISYYSGRFIDLKYKSSDVKAAMISSIQSWIEKNVRSDDYLYILNPNSNEIKKTNKKNIIAELSDLSSRARFVFDAKRAQESISSFFKKQAIQQYEVHYFTVIKPEETNSFITHFFIDQNYKFTNNGILSAEIVEKSLVENSLLSLRVRFHDKIKEFDEILVVVDKETVFNDQADSALTIRIPIGRFKNGTHSAYVKLISTDDYEQDNIFFFNFTLRENQKLVVFYEKENSVLRSLFTAFPDSSIRVDITSNSTVLRYNLPEYQYIIYEGNTSNKSVATQLSQYIRQKRGIFIFVPPEELDFFSWNKSALGDIIQFQSILGQKNNPEQSFIISPINVRTYLLGNFYQFERKKNNAITFHYAYTIKNQDFSVIIGDAKRKFLVQSSNFYSFLTPFNERASKFIYDSRFIPILYGLIHTGQKYNQIDLKKKEVIFYHDHQNTPLFLKSDRIFPLYLKRKKFNQTVYHLPDNIPPGNYEDGQKNLVSINDETINLREITHSNTINKILAGASEYHYWRIFLILALLFYLAELWLARSKF